MNCVQIVVIAAVLATVYGLGNDAFSANLCTDPLLLLNSTSSVLPGSQVTINCSVMYGTMRWYSSQFADYIVIDNLQKSGMALGGAFTVQFDSLTTEFCITATAMIDNVQESMDGLDLMCADSFNESSSTIIDVIDPPSPVNFTLQQNCNEVVVSWTRLSDDPCPITGYIITIIPGTTETVAANETVYTHFVDENDSGNTLQISVSGISAAGTGNSTYKNITVRCIPTDLSLCAVVNVNGSFHEHNLAAIWKGTFVPGVDSLLLQYSSSSSPSVDIPIEDEDTTMYLFTNVNSGIHSAKVSSMSQKNNTCFSTSNQIEYTDVLMNIDVQSEIDYAKAYITLKTNATFMTVMNSDLELVPNSGSEVCAVGHQNNQLLSVHCTGLNSESTYNLTVRISAGSSNLCVIINVTLNTLMEPTFEVTTPSTPVSVTTPSTPVSGLPMATIVGIAVGIAVMALLVVVVILIIISVYVKKKSQKDTDSPVALVEIKKEREEGEKKEREKKDPLTGEAATYEDPAVAQHKTAPTGDMYAVVEKQPSRRTAPSTPAAEPTTYQDPETIQRQAAPIGEAYALPDKQSKPVYAEVNKYADLDVTGALQGGSSRPPNSQEVHYSQVHPSQVHQL